jgi:DNA-binding IclR family transcriptional regulator
VVGERSIVGRTGHTITDRDALREELRPVRERRIAFDRGEAFEEMHSVAAPITDDGTAVGARGSSVTPHASRGNDCTKTSRGWR